MAILWLISIPIMGFWLSGFHDGYLVALGVACWVLILGVLPFVTSWIARTNAGPRRRAIGKVLVTFGVLAVLTSPWIDSYSEGDTMILFAAGATIVSVGLGAVWSTEGPAT